MCGTVQRSPNVGPRGGDGTERSLHSTLTTPQGFLRVGCVSAPRFDGVKKYSLAGNAFDATMTITGSLTVGPSQLSLLKGQRARAT